MKCLFLYNPNSGAGTIEKKLAYICKTLGKKYDRVDAVATKSGEDMTEKARQGAQEYDAIVFSGGDGSFNRVLQGIGNSGVHVGYLPAGTANDVAKSLSIPKNTKRALKIITEGHVKNLDCMLVNGSHYCMYIAAAGAFTQVTYSTPQKYKRALGKLAYAVEGLKNNMKLDVFPVKITCGEHSYEGSAVFLFVLNGRSVAGFPVNKDASMADGLLETAVVRQAHKPNLRQKIGAYFSMAALFLRGVKVRRRNIQTLYGKRVEIKTRADVVWDFDGEEGICGDITVETLEGRVKMFVPKRKKV